MKGLERIPSLADLAQAYSSLQARVDEVSCAQLALWSQWVRFDPRLGEVWSDALEKHWRSLSPLLFNEELARQPWPQAAGVLLAQLGEMRMSGSDQYRLFNRWSGMVMHGIGALNSQQDYFIGTRAFASRKMLEDLRGSLASYSRWGFYGREIFVNKAVSGRTLVPAEQRRRVLDELVRSMPRLRVADYREALGGWVGPRQAEKDLAAHPRLVARGNTRARFYVRKSGRSTQ